jgi:hypothetical protein
MCMWSVLVSQPFEVYFSHSSGGPDCVMEALEKVPSAVSHVRSVCVPVTVRFLSLSL